MDLDSALQALRDCLGGALGADVALVVRLQEAPSVGGALVLWPWHVEDVASMQDVPRRPDPSGGRPPPAVPGATVRVLVLGDELGLLSRARAVLHRNPVLQVDGRTLRVQADRLTVDEACALFRAAGVPMQAALAVALQG